MCFRTLASCLADDCVFTFRLCGDDEEFGLELWVLLVLSKYHSEKFPVDDTQHQDNLKLCADFGCVVFRCVDSVLCGFWLVWISDCVDLCPCCY